MRGRDATESSDQRDARPGSAASSSSGGSRGEYDVIASPGVTTSVSVSGVIVMSLMGDGSRGLPIEKDGDGVAASSASLRNCGDDADVESAGRAGRCLRLGLEPIGCVPLSGTVALLLLPRPMGLGTARCRPASSSARYTADLFSASVSRSSRRESVDEMDG